ncbi:MAG: hypothetical protein A2176_02970 [Spirochaetes bacterium RBG_13_51_14]|nr:MAG: hypothetical protein A2176_02970 [Spirochaetes bacterium RBG_13_51_14]
MKYFFPGFIAGALAAFFLFTPTAGMEIYPEWWSGIGSIPAMQRGPETLPTRARFFVKIGDRDYYILNGSGAVDVTGSVADGLTAFSGSGRYYVKYQKVGTDVEFFNANGERFWKLESPEYPYLSHNGKIVLLMNGDHTAIRVVDYNGTIRGAPISGRTCTAISFSDSGDNGGVGFLDGSYYFVNAAGTVMSNGMTPPESMVKGVAVSGNGLYAAVHHGNNQKDYVRIIDIESKDHETVELAHAHPVKTSLFVSDSGCCTVIDVDRILHISSSGKVRFSIAIPQKRSGHSSVGYRNGVYSVSYTMKNGSSKLLLFNEDGVILFSKEFPSESFLDASLQENFLFLRGSDNIFCYSIHRL